MRFVHRYDCNGTAAQLWQVNLGSTTIRPANSNFCVDAGTCASKLTKSRSIHRLRIVTNFINVQPQPLELLWKFGNASAASHNNNGSSTLMVSFLLPTQVWLWKGFSRWIPLTQLLLLGLCLDLTNGNTTNTNVLQVWECTPGNTNQVWTNWI